ncbi:MAG: chromate transporter [Acutalibacteraceae bacterium]|jgi:chromate transporter|nr:chromate transporter [Clostridiales bacterium]
MNNLLLICFEFLKTGLFAIGGGLATIPFLFNMSEKYPEWFSSSELADMIAVSESTPGSIGVNMATFAGFKVAGVAGAILATCSLVLPSFVIIFIISKFLIKYSESPYVNATFAGLRPAVAGLITTAAYAVFKVAIFTETISSFEDILPNISIPSLIIFVVILVSLQFKKLRKIHPVFFIAVAAFLGIVLKL